MRRIGRTAWAMRVAVKDGNTLRELQYADLVSIKKQGCGKPNRIYPKHYDAVSNTDFKKSGCGTPED